MDDSPIQDNAELEYFSVLEGILRTNPKKKLDNVLRKLSELKTSPRGSKSTATPAGGGDNPPQENTSSTESSSGQLKQCTISQVIKCNQHCISEIQIVRDNLLSAFMATTQLNSKSKAVTVNITRQLSQTVGKLINLVSEASSLTQRIHENAIGLHIATDFFRDPKDLTLLDFSNSGRIPVSHFSCIEATSMCLAWIHTSAEKLAEEETTTTENKSLPIRNNFIKIYKSFETAMADLCQASELASQIFRVLLYCNAKGKEMLQDFIARLKPPEINDLITEIQMMRRQFDEINIIMDRLGWSLADIWGRCTGTEIRFEDIRKEGCLKLKNFEEHERRKKNLVGQAGGKSMEKTKTNNLLPKGSNMSKFLTKIAKSEAKLARKSKASTSLTKGNKGKKKFTQSKKGNYSRLEQVLGKRSSELSFIANGICNRNMKCRTRNGPDNTLPRPGQITEIIMPPKGDSVLKTKAKKIEKSATNNASPQVGKK